MQTQQRQLTEYEAQIKKLREYSVERETAELMEQIKAFEGDRKAYADIVASLLEYVAKRTELATAVLKMPHTTIALFEPVKTTGELKSIFRFDYNGYPYSTLSLSEKMLAGFEITAMLRKITGLSVPVCIDNTESVAAFDEGLIVEKVGGRFRWLSTGGDGFKDGTGITSYIHVVGDTSSDTLYITEGGMKSDIASFLSGGKLFIGLTGVQNVRYLRKVVESLHPKRIIECMTAAQIRRYKERSRKFKPSAPRSATNIAALHGPLH